MARKVIPIQPVDDSSQVVSLYQSEAKIYARGVPGWFSRWRWAMVCLTQLVFYGLPWLTINDRQAMLFDLVARRFYIFKLVLYPQDLIYLTGLLVISALALFLFTAVAGRLWCGYTCPQTVYTEIFMWVERKIEGDRTARMRLDKAPWSAEKVGRKSAKQLVWIAIGLWTGFSFVGYFTPIRELATEVLQLSMGPWQLFWVLFHGFATYGNAGWMREQVCKYMCPYARFQSAMFDADTLIVTYDVARGEGRGSRPRSDTPAQYQAKGLGDCVDCGVMARQVGQGQVENVYCLQIMNATEQEQRYVLTVAGLAGVQITSNPLLSVDAAASRWVPVRVGIEPQRKTQLPKVAVRTGNFDGVGVHGRWCDSRRLSFFLDDITRMLKRRDQHHLGNMQSALSY